MCSKRLVAVRIRRRYTKIKKFKNALSHLSTNLITDNQKEYASETGYDEINPKHKIRKALIIATHLPEYGTKHTAAEKWL